MEQVKQSLQETASKERESYKSVFLKKRSVCNRQSVYISGEIQKRIVQIVGVITNKQVSIGNFIDNVLEEHLGALSTGKKCRKEYSTSQKRKTYEYRNY